MGVGCGVNREFNRMGFSGENWKAVVNNSFFIFREIFLLNIEIFRSFVLDGFCFCFFGSSGEVSDVLNVYIFSGLLFFRR